MQESLPARTISEIMTFVDTEDQRLLFRREFGSNIAMVFNMDHISEPGQYLRLRSTKWNFARRMLLLLSLLGAMPIALCFNIIITVFIFFKFIYDEGFLGIFVVVAIPSVYISWLFSYVQLLIWIPFFRHVNEEGNLLN